MRAVLPLWRGEPVAEDVGRPLRLDAGDPDAVVVVTAGRALGGSRRRRRRRARARAPGTGGGRSCGRGGTGMRSSEVLLDLARCCGQPQDPMRPLPGSWPALTRPARAARVRTMSSSWNFGTGAPTSDRRRSASASRAAPASVSPCSTAITASTVWHTARTEAISKSASIRFRKRLAPFVSWISSASFAAVAASALRPCARWRSADTAWARNKMWGLRRRRPASRAWSTVDARVRHVALFEQRPCEPRVQRADETSHADVLCEVDSLLELLDCLSVMAVAFVEVGEHAERDREHHGTVACGGTRRRRAGSAAPRR